MRRKNFRIILHIHPFFDAALHKMCTAFCTMLPLRKISQAVFGIYFDNRVSEHTRAYPVQAMPHQVREKGCQTVLCAELILFFFCLFGSAENDLIAVAAVLDSTVDPADRSGTCAGFFYDFMKYVSFMQHFCYLQTLCHGIQFLIGAQILEEGIAFLCRVQHQDRLE